MDEYRLKSWLVKILPSAEAETAEGTGFWAAEGGYVLACAHVVQNIDSLWVAYGRDKAPAEKVAQEGDIALLKVQGMNGQVAPLGSEWRRGDIIDSLGYQYEGRQSGVGYFPMKGVILGQSEYEGLETITLEEAIHVKPGASGAPALNRQTGKVIGIISNKWEQQQIAFALSLGPLLKQWDILAPRFRPVDYRQEPIFAYYNTFVGRQKEIEAVQAFIQGKGGDYLLFQGKAGLGKTALAAELARQGAAKALGAQLSTMVFFIREESSHNTPEVFLETINRQLLDLLGEAAEIPVPLVEKERQYQRLWAKVEGQVSPHNRLLILLDGLDEAAQEGTQPLVKYLPPKVTPYIYWLLTSRPLPDVLSAVPTTHFLRQARSYWLTGLGPEEVRALLRQAGDQIERSDEFITRLIVQTRGEPLFLRFLCQDIAGWDTDAEGHLQAVPEEVSDYFLMQFRLLRERLKKAQNRNLPLDILKVLLVTFSGLTAEEMAGIFKASLLDVQEALELIERFLLGSGRYELMHLEFRRTLEEKLVREEEKQALLEAQLLPYCAAYWSKDYPKERYALRYYLRHLFALKRYQEMFELCQAGYLEIKLGRLISPELLEEDYQALFEACRATGDLEGLVRWGFQRAGISDKVTALRDIETLPEAIETLANWGTEETDRWWEEGVGLCSLIPGVTGKVEGLLGLCKGLAPDQQVAPERVLRQVSVLLKEASFQSNKEKLTVKYVEELCRWGGAYLAQAIQVVAEIGGEYHRSHALADVAQGFVQFNDPQQAADGLVQVLQAATQIRDEQSRSYALIAVAQGFAQLSDPQQATDGLAQVLQTATQIKDEENFAKALAAVAQGFAQLSNPQQAADGLAQVLQVATQIGDERDRSYALAAVAQGFAHLNDPQRATDGLAQVLRAAAQIENERSCSYALIVVAQGFTRISDPQQAIQVLEQALHMATQIRVERDRAEALAGVAQDFAEVGDLQRAAQVLGQAIQVEEAQVKYVWPRSKALRAVEQGFAQVGDPQRATQFLAQALQATTQVGFQLPYLIS